jgi:hypothetical protein
LRRLNAEVLTAAGQLKPVTIKSPKGQGTPPCRLCLYHSSADRMRRAQNVRL